MNALDKAKSQSARLSKAAYGQAMDGLDQAKRGVAPADSPVVTSGEQGYEAGQPNMEQDVAVAARKILQTLTKGGA